MTDDQKEFYDGLAMGNAVSYQQAQNNIMLSLTSKLTDAIINGDDTDKVKELMGVLKGLKEEEQRE